MIKAVTAIAVAVALTASVALGKLGETPEQMESFPPTRTVEKPFVTVREWVGKKVTHTGAFQNGVAIVESFWYNDHRAMTEEEIDKFLKPYNSYVKEDQIADEQTLVRPLSVTRGGEIYALVTYDKLTHVLSVWKPEPFKLAFAKKSGPSPKDCAVVATENLVRLQKVAHWARAIAFFYAVNGTPAGGHAMVVWKIYPDSKVLVIDVSGTFEIETTSEDVTEVAKAMAAKLTEKFDVPVTIIKPQFIGQTK
jgi:hypothetical protein